MRNENTSLPNKNTLYIGMSGSGKSHQLKNNREVQKAKRVVLFDPNSDHEAGRRATHRKEFLMQLSMALKMEGSWRVAYSPVADNRVDEHEFFCEVVCRMLDGRKITTVIDEELAASCESASKAAPWHRKLMNEGRKYGMVYHGVIQIPQRIPKDVFDNCFYLYVGKSLRLPAYVEDAFGISRKMGIALKPHEFMLCAADGTQKKIA